MSHPFSKAAVEAAAKAICEKHGRKWDMEFGFNSETRDWWIEEAEAALSAAFDHARGEGHLTEGKHTSFGENGAGTTEMGPNEFWRGDFKFIVIKDAGE